MRGKVRGRHLMRPLLADTAWRPVDVTDRAPVRELEVIDVSGRQVKLFPFSTTAVEAMRAPMFAGRPRTRTDSPQVQRAREASLANLVKHKAWLTRVKQSAGCSVCGHDDPKALEFHHVNPCEKRFGISGGSVARRRESVYAEMQKCVLVCSNCHRAIHHRDLDVSDIPRFDPWAWEAKPS